MFSARNRRRLRQLLENKIIEPFDRQLLRSKKWIAFLTTTYILALIAAIWLPLPAFPRLAIGSASIAVGLLMSLLFYYMRSEDIRFVQGLAKSKERIITSQSRRIVQRFSWLSITLMLLGLLPWSFGISMLIPTSNVPVQPVAIFWITGYRAINPFIGTVPELSVSLPHSLPWFHHVTTIVLKSFVFLFMGGLLLRYMEIRGVLRQTLSSLETEEHPALQRIERLAEVSPGSVTSAIEAAYEEHRHNIPRTVLHVRALGRVPTSASQSLLIDVVKDTQHDSTVIAAAITGLATFNNEQVKTLIRRIYQDATDEKIKSACIDAFGRLEDAESTSTLLHLIEDTSTPIERRDRAAISFHLISKYVGETHESALVDALLQMGATELERNEQGCRRFKRPTDGGCLVLIPYGPFRRGSNLSEAERPEREIYLPSFLIDEYAVTVQQFRRFLSEKENLRVLWQTTFGQDCPYRDSRNSAADIPVFPHEDTFKDPDRNRPGQPMTGLPWHVAVMYARWCNQLEDVAFDEGAPETFGLPLESQWEKAARGRDGRTYPWGDVALSSDLASYLNLRGLHPVSGCRGNCSPYGVFGMAGNCWEWCGNWMHKEAWTQYSPLFGILTEGKSRVVRGGCWDGFDFFCRANYRLYERDLPDDSRVGVRCAVNDERGIVLLDPERVVEAVQGMASNESVEEQP